jgi:large subunit ribosomal protein L24
MKIKTGDNVVVIAGKSKNMTGKVIKVNLKSNKVVVEGVNKVTRHVKKTRERAGEKIQFEAPIDVSNLMIIDPKDKKRARIGYTVDSKGKKTRISKKSNSTL